MDSIANNLPLPALCEGAQFVFAIEREHFLRDRDRNMLVRALATRSNLVADGDHEEGDKERKGRVGRIVRGCCDLGVRALHEVLLEAEDVGEGWVGAGGGRDEFEVGVELGDAILGEFLHEAEGEEEVLVGGRGKDGGVVEVVRACLGDVLLKRLFVLLLDREEGGRLIDIAGDGDVPEVGEKENRR